METRQRIKKKVMATVTALIILGLSAPTMAAENQETMTLRQIVDTAMKIIR